ncbi:serine hydroxymethyltransferase [Vibrio tubiashii]|uniref:serine hydroxymethyltransferase n=1 Tax=Vibrio tubiashii TaxID=29498 RepID=UPI00234EEF10|nr:serine hydroxymethyltransferase [Vibrio tubiashii]WCP68311.1 serine hydroxymethyltransferase [Vibrio tubiashii]
MCIQTQCHEQRILVEAERFIENSTTSELRNYLIDLVNKHEKVRVELGINLVAAEAPMSSFARNLLSCDLGSRASGGAIGRRSRVFTGLDAADEIEALSISLLKGLFDCKYADHRPLGGLHANMIVYASLKRYLYTSDLMTLDLVHGGNSSNHILGPPGVLGYSISFIPVDERSLKIDLDRFEDVAKRKKPSLVSLGAGVNLFPFPVTEIKEIVSRWSGKILFDGAHQAGLIAAGMYPNPLTQGADVFTASTGKTFSGPQGGLICWNSGELSDALSTTIFPTLTGSHQLNRVAALVASSIEMKTHGKEYMAQGISNAKRFASALYDEGLDVLYADYDFTETHQVLVHWKYPEGAKAACFKLASVGIFANAVPLPGDNSLLSGIRFGMTEVTRLGIRPDEIIEVAKITSGVLHGRYSSKRARSRIAGLATVLSNINYCLEEI